MLALGAVLLALLPLPGCFIGTLIGFVFFLIALPFKIIIPLLKAILTLGQKALPYLLLYGLFVSAPPGTRPEGDGVPPPEPPLLAMLDPARAPAPRSPRALLANPFGWIGAMPALPGRPGESCRAGESRRAGGDTRADVVLAVPLDALRDEATRRLLAERLAASGLSWRAGPTADLVSLLREPSVMDRLVCRWLGEGATVVMGGPAGLLGPGDPLPAPVEPAGSYVRDLPLDPALCRELESRDVPVEPRGVWAPSRARLGP